MFDKMVLDQSLIKAFCFEICVKHFLNDHFPSKTVLGLKKQSLLLSVFRTEMSGHSFHLSSSLHSKKSVSHYVLSKPGFCIASKKCESLSKIRLKCLWWVERNWFIAFPNPIKSPFKVGRYVGEVKHYPLDFFERRRKIKKINLLTSEWS